MHEPRRMPFERRTRFVVAWRCRVVLLDAECLRDSREVDDALHAANGLVDSLATREVAPHDLGARDRAVAPHQAADRPTHRDQPFDKVAADESGCTGDEDHGSGADGHRHNITGFQCKDTACNIGGSRLAGQFQVPDRRYAMQ